MNEGQRRRILRVRETQKRIALGRLAQATRSVEEIGRRDALLGRLIADTMPRAGAGRGIDLIGRMHFSARLQGAQLSLARARSDAVIARKQRSADVLCADRQVEIASRMVEAEAARGVGQALRRSLEEMGQQAKQSGKGQT